MLNVRLYGTLQEALKSGVVLCNLANAVQPGSCASPSEMSMPFPQRENVAKYLSACTALGIKGFESFQTIDLFEDKDMHAVVTNVHALGRVAQTLGFNGPTLGAKMASQNTRHFTEAQLNEAKNTAPTFSRASAGRVAHERPDGPNATFNRTKLAQPVKPKQG